MRALKQVIRYFVWIITALLIGIVYMRLVLGPNNIQTEGLWYLIHLFYDFGKYYVGIIIGSVVALLFILCDVFYLKKKLKCHFKSKVIRFTTLLVITGFVAVVHYMLEKVIDII